MSAAKRTIVEVLWHKLLKTPFDVKCLARGVIEDGGIDTEALTPTDIENVFFDRYGGDWYEIAFSFTELLAFYSVEKLSSAEFVRAVFVSLYLGDAMRHRDDVLSGEFDWILKIVSRQMDLGDDEFRLTLFTEILGCGSTEDG